MQLNFLIFILQNDEIYFDTQNIKWYLLSVKDQERFMLMLLSAQKPHNIMAGVVPSNLNTFINVRNIINYFTYKYMVNVNFLTVYAANLFHYNALNKDSLKIFYSYLFISLQLRNIIC